MLEKCCDADNAHAASLYKEPVSAVLSAAEGGRCDRALHLHLGALAHDEFGNADTKVGRRIPVVAPAQTRERIAGAGKPDAVRRPHLTRRESNGPKLAISLGFLFVGKVGSEFGTSRQARKFERAIPGGDIRTAYAWPENWKLSGLVVPHHRHRVNRLRPGRRRQAEDLPQFRRRQT